MKAALAALFAALVAALWYAGRPEDFATAGAFVKTNAVAISWWTAGVCGYMAPFLLAATRRARSAKAIFLVNLILGWTLVGWLGALIWAGAGASKTPSSPRRQHYDPDDEYDDDRPPCTREGGWAAVPQASGADQADFGRNVVAKGYSRYRTRASKRYLCSLQRGAPLELRREPGNKHDENAIVVYAGQHKIGHVERDWAAVAAPKMDDGVKVTAKYLRHNEHHRHPWVFISLLANRRVMRLENVA